MAEIVRREGGGGVDLEGLTTSAPHENFNRARECCECIIRELTILGRERRPRLQKTKTAITEIKAVQLCRKHNFKDLLSE